MVDDTHSLIETSAACLNQLRETAHSATLYVDRIIIRGKNHYRDTQQWTTTQKTRQRGFL